MLDFASSWAPKPLGISDEPAILILKKFKLIAFYSFNPFKLNGIFHCYPLDQSISV